MICLGELAHTNTRTNGDLRMRHNRRHSFRCRHYPKIHTRTRHAVQFAYCAIALCEFLTFLTPCRACDIEIEHKVRTLCQRRARACQVSLHSVPHILDRVCTRPSATSSSETTATSSTIAIAVRCCGLGGWIRWRDKRAYPLLVLLPHIDRHPLSV